ncbi:ethylene receptor 2-like [Typha latifolia]|uniref:ethylene receptor 2-like n=1 Tax=Typha latifolia TaxID=4733 RepID=UPI003C2AC44B
MQASAYASCAGCEEDPSLLLSVENILRCQKVSDLMIALAYFSIALELFFFVTCSAIFPFRWIIFQFGAFIVLCGLTHLVATFTNSFVFLFALTVLKFLTALVSLATAFSIIPLIPQMLRVFVRDGLLRQKARDLDRELGLIRRQEAASFHVRMLTADIRRTLDRHTILETTLIQLSNALFLQDCAIWMPMTPSSMSLTHRLHPEPHWLELVSIASADPDVVEVIKTTGVVLLKSNSPLVASATGTMTPVGSAAAKRLPLLQFGEGGGKPELVKNSQAYAILVLVLPPRGNKNWTDYELEIIEVVADQVTAALSHAAVLEESLLIREKLLEQNLSLDLANQEAVLAKKSRDSFQSMMTQKLVGPIRSMAAMLSPLQLEKLSLEQMAMVRGGLVLSSLMEEAAQVGKFENEKLDLELKLRPFHIQFAVEEILFTSRILCACQGVSFEFSVSGEKLGPVVGDGRRVIQAVLCMVRSALDFGDRGTVFLQVSAEGASRAGSFETNHISGEQNASNVMIKLEFEVRRTCLLTTNNRKGAEKPGDRVPGHARNLRICEKLARLMHGGFSISSLSPDLQRNMKLLIRLQRGQSGNELIYPRYMQLDTSRCSFIGMKILMLDGDQYNISITSKLLEKIGCQLSIASSWYHCLEMLHLKGNKFHLLLIDLQILEANGLEISTRIKKLQIENCPLIVALTAKTDADTRERCLQEGVHGVVCKPVILQDMVEELQQITQKIQAPPLLL